MKRKQEEHELPAEKRVKTTHELNLETVQSILPSIIPQKSSPLNFNQLIQHFHQANQISSENVDTVTCAVKIEDRLEFVIFNKKIILRPSPTGELTINCEICGPKAFLCPHFTALMSIVSSEPDLLIDLSEFKKCIERVPSQQIVYIILNFLSRDQNVIQSLMMHRKNVETNKSIDLCLLKEENSKSLTSPCFYNVCPLTVNEETIKTYSFVDYYEEAQRLLNEGKVPCVYMYKKGEIVSLCGVNSGINRCYHPQPDHGFEGVKISFKEDGKIATTHCSCNHEELMDLVLYCPHILATLMVCNRKPWCIIETDELEKWLLSLHTQDLVMLTLNLALQHRLVSYLKQELYSWEENHFIEPKTNNRKFLESLRPTRLINTEFLSHIVDSAIKEYQPFPCHCVCDECKAMNHGFCNFGCLKVSMNDELLPPHRKEFLELLPKIEQFIKCKDLRSAETFLQIITRTLEKWIDYSSQHKEIKDYYLQLSAKWTLFFEQDEEDHSNHTKDLFRWLESSDHTVSHHFFLAIMEGWNKRWKLKPLEYKNEILNLMLNLTPTKFKQVIKVISLAEHFRRNSRKFDAFMLGVRLLESELLQGDNEYSSDSSDGFVICYTECERIRSLRAEIGAWLCSLMKHRPLEVHNKPFSLYEITARAIVSELHDNVLVNIHKLQPITSDIIVEDILYRLAIACCVKNLKINDLPILEEVLRSNKETTAADLLNLIITCKGRPNFKSYLKIRDTAPKWMTELVYEHIKITPSHFYDSAVDFVREIFHQEGVEKALNFAKKSSNMETTDPRMIAAIIDELKSIKVKPNELITLIRTAESSLWVPYNVSNFQVNISKLPDFWGIIDYRLTDFSEYSPNDQLHTDCLIKAIAQVNKNIATYLEDVSNSYFQLSTLIRDMTANQKTYQKVTDLLVKLKPHFYGSKRENEWDFLIKVLKIKHKQKKKLQTMITTNLDRLSINPYDWLEPYLPQIPSEIT